MALFDAYCSATPLPRAESARSLKYEPPLVEMAAFIRALCLRMRFADQLRISSSPNLLDRYEKGGNSFIRFAVSFVSNFYKDLCKK